MPMITRGKMRLIKAQLYTLHQESRKCQDIEQFGAVHTEFKALLNQHNAAGDEILQGWFNDAIKQIYAPIYSQDDDGALIGQELNKHIAKLKRHLTKSRELTTSNLFKRKLEFKAEDAKEPGADAKIMKP